ncbi:MAG TPA: hypothetical protein VHA82_09585 [Ramlibacter sp.]|nr:hypothetical protein [Ramlibacter sp.]
MEDCFAWTDEGRRVAAAFEPLHRQWWQVCEQACHAESALAVAWAVHLHAGGPRPTQEQADEADRLRAVATSRFNAAMAYLRSNPI